MENLDFFKNDLSLVDWLRQYAKTEEEREEVHIRGFLGKMIFSGDEALKKSNVLSGGEKVRCMLSRMMMKRANILVLDEPTSAMDAEAEARIFDHFREVTQKQMAILISHRFSTVRMADQIVVLDKGKVIERGSHEELMVQNGHYAHLFTIQAKGYQ